MAHLPTRTVDAHRDRLFQWLRRGLDLLFPPRCVACSRVGNWFCNACQDSVELVPLPICPRCGRPTPANHLCSRCQTRPTALDGIRSAAIHDGALRKAVHHLKYQGRRELADPLGQMLFAYWQKEEIQGHLVIPVPLHAGRRQERGYNQAGLLARSFADKAGLEVDETSLVRMRATAPQVGLGAQERQINVRDAFVWAGDRLDGARVLLIDDVCTTGSTLEACALALRETGLQSVWALTLARAR